MCPLGILKSMCWLHARRSSSHLTEFLLTNKDYSLSKLEIIHNLRKGMQVGRTTPSKQRMPLFFKETILTFYRANYKVLNLTNG